MTYYIRSGNGVMLRDRKALATDSPCRETGPEDRRIAPLKPSAPTTLTVLCETISQIPGTTNRTTQQSQLASPAREVSTSLARGGKPVVRLSSARQCLVQDILRGIHVRVFRHTALDAIVSLALPVFGTDCPTLGASL